MSEWTSEEIVVTRNKFFKVKPISEITEGKGVYFEHGNTRLAIFKHGENYYAMDNWCPHQYGSLYLGDIEDIPYTCDKFTELQKGQITKDDLPKKPAVICPLHGWAFFLETGESPTIANMVQDTFPTKVQDDYLYVQIPIQEKF